MGEIIPVPRRILQGTRRFNYAGRRFLVVPESAEFRLKNAAIRLADTLSRNAAVPLRVTAGAVAAADRFADMVFDPSVPPQGFRLESGEDGFLLRAGDAAGAFYGLAAIGDICEDGRGDVPELTVDDEPDFPRRGYMLDISRCKVPTMASFKATIDAIAHLRYNEFQLYMEHTFAFARDERVWFDSSPLQPAEIMELDEYCRDRFIELVPNLNSFAHLERWLQFKEYRSVAECEEPWYCPAWDMPLRTVLAPGPEALAFVDRLYGEFLPNFTSRRLNLGGDETMELGHGKSARLSAERGTTRVYLDFLLQLVDLAARHGRSVQFWGDIIMHNPELIPELPSTVTALEWGYERNHPYEADVDRFAAAGIPFHVCPGTSVWNSLIGRAENMLANVEAAARAGRRAGAAGLLLTDWGNGGYLHYWPISWPGIAHGALSAWNAGADNRAALPRAIDRAFGGGEETGDCLLELGRVVDAIPPLPENGTYCFWALTQPDEKWKAETLDAIRAEDVAAARERLRSWRERLLGCPPPAPRLVLEELENGAAMADLGLERLLFLKTGHLDADRWRDGLRHVIGRHTDLWLARNRPGGLHESSECLRARLD